MSLSQQFLDRKDKWSNNVYMGDYSELRVDIFQYLYKELKELMYSEKQVSLMTDDLLEFVDKDFIKKTNEQKNT